MIPFVSFEILTGPNFIAEDLSSSQKQYSVNLTSWLDKAEHTVVALAKQK